MNASQPAARRHTVPALVTAAVAAWFVLATGTAFAATNQPADVAAAPARVTLSPQGTMRLTVVAQRTQPAPVHTAAVREASRN